MKVAVISAGFEPRNARLQPHQTLLELSRQLADQGHEVVLISDGASHLPARELFSDLPLCRLDSVRMVRFRPNRHLLAAIASESPDILLWHLSLSGYIHQTLHHPFSQKTIGILTNPVHRPLEILRLGPRKLSSNFDLMISHLLGAWVPGVLIQRGFAPGGLQGMITLSETTRQFLIEKGAPEERIWVVPPGVDRAWLDAGFSSAQRLGLRRKLGFDEGDCVVTYFGSPAPVRGLCTMLQAVQQAARSRPELRLSILARRQPNEWVHQISRLKSIVQSNGLRDRVLLVDGFLEKQKLIEHVAASDVVCLPFELVPSDVPLSILEAMALGKGVITTRVACIPELVEPERGFLISPDSVDALARQLVAIARSPGDSEERGQRARAFVETQRTWENAGQVLQQILVRNHG
jgi:glycosyltransferase involved in cell wall biosynthesis